MRFARPLLAFAASLLLSLPSAAVESFLAELEDLPLPVGLNEQPGGLLFDSADGRIVEAKATGDLAAEQVRQFYDQTLTQLGWQTIGPLQFRRDNETLTIRLDDRARPLAVHFMLTPAH